MSIPVYEYDGIPFERINGKWICKAIAMRGPTGTMLNKEVPELYAKPIEQAYQASLNSKDKDLKIRLIGRRDEGTDEVQEIDPMEKKIEKLKKKLEQKEEKLTTQKVEPIRESIQRNVKRAGLTRKKSKEKIQKKVKKGLVSGFNPFAK